ncbi:hypothetical protein T210_0125765 [Burkholderia pseudomallei MSHR6137]|nr:hypothetical protein T210_0125765 [Burkholderia pseudomallei MSHR6137]
MRSSKARSFATCSPTCARCRRRRRRRRPSKKRTNQHKMPPTAREISEYRSFQRLQIAFLFTRLYHCQML